MNDISVIIITHRQDDRFRAAINSASWADEIIVVTIGQLSLNKKEFPQAKILPGDASIKDFASQRNKALLQASCRWVLFLDSDEQLKPLAETELRELITLPTLAGIYFRRQDTFQGHSLKWGEVGNLWLLRMGLRSELSFERPVHEIGRVDGSTTRAKTKISHFPHPTLSQFFKAVSIYSEREAEYRLSQLKSFSLLELLTFPLLKFIHNFILRLGFLDGWVGLVYATMMSLHSGMVRIFLYEKTRN